MTSSPLDRVWPLYPQIRQVLERRGYQQASPHATVFNRMAKLGDPLSDKAARVTTNHVILTEGCQKLEKTHLQFLTENVRYLFR